MMKWPDLLTVLSKLMNYPVMRNNNTILKSLNKERVTNVNEPTGEIILSSDHYMDIITETDYYCKDGWQVQYEYTKRKYRIFGPETHYVKLIKERNGLDSSKS